MLRISKSKACGRGKRVNPVHFPLHSDAKVSPFIIAFTRIKLYQDSTELIVWPQVSNLFTSRCMDYIQCKFSRTVFNLSKIKLNKLLKLNVMCGKKFFLTQVYYWMLILIRPELFSQYTWILHEKHLCSVQKDALKYQLPQGGVLILTVTI